MGIASQEMQESIVVEHKLKRTRERMVRKMVKKVVLGTLLVGLIGILVVGAVIRTMDKTELVTEARGQGRGRIGSEVSVSTRSQQGQGRGGNGQGGGYGRSDVAELQYASYEISPDTWAIYEGMVAEAPEAGGDLVVITDGGQEIAVGTGPGYMETQGFMLQTGEPVRVKGYWEDDELKAVQVTRLRDGQKITLRDEYGRPAWSGSGGRALEQQASIALGGGQGGRGQGGRGQGGYTGEGFADAPGDGTGTGQAQVEQWLTLHGMVVSVDESSLIVQADDGEQVVVENRPWWFAQEQGFAAQPGDEVILVGFYENDEFEVGQLENVSIDLAVPIREENGRPLWAGGGRRGG